MRILQSQIHKTETTWGLAVQHAIDKLINCAERPVQSSSWAFPFQGLSWHGNDLKNIPKGSKRIQKASDNRYIYIWLHDCDRMTIIILYILQWYPLFLLIYIVLLFSCGHRWEALDRLALRAVIKWDVRLEKGNNCSWTFILLMLFILVVRSEQETHKACQAHLMFRNVPDNDVCIFLHISLYNCWIWQEDCSTASICKLWDNILYIIIHTYYIILSFGNQDLNVSKHVQTHFLFNPLFSKWDATVATSRRMLCPKLEAQQPWQRSCWRHCRMVMIKVFKVPAVPPTWRCVQKNHHIP